MIVECSPLSVQPPSAPWPPDVQEFMEWPTFSIAQRKLLIGKMLPGNSGSGDRYCSRLPWASLASGCVARSADDCCGRAGPDQLSVAVLAAFRVMG